MKKRPQLYTIIIIAGVLLTSALIFYQAPNILTSSPVFRPADENKIEYKAQPGATIVKGGTAANITVRLANITEAPPDVTYRPECFSICNLPLKIKYDGTNLPSTTRLNPANSDQLYFSKAGVTGTDTLQFLRAEVIENGETIPLEDVELKKGQEYVINYVFYRKPSLGLQSVDVIPTILGFSFPEFAWFNSSWNRRVNITINESQIIASHLNFPVLINITDTNLATYAQADGDDILFANDSVQFPHEIEYFNSTDGRLVAWVNIPNLTGGFNFSMYYNNSAASSQQNRPATWNNDYRLVWHLSNGTNLDGKDSTKYGKNGTVNSASANISGKMDGAGDFDGTSDDLEANVTSIGTVNTGTVSMWIKRERTSTYEIIMENNQVPSAGGSQPSFEGDSTIDFWVANACADNFGTVTTDVWTYLVGTWDGTSVTAYLNGTAPSPTSCSSTNRFDLFSIGGRSGGSFSYLGLIDEVRISNVSRNIQWIVTEYANQLNTTKFTIFGSQESIPSYASNVSVQLSDPYSIAQGSSVIINATVVDIGGVDIVNGTVRKPNGDYVNFTFIRNNATIASGDLESGTIVKSSISYTNGHFYYNFSDTTANKAYFTSDNIAQPPSTFATGMGGAEVSADCYTNLTTSNDARCNATSNTAGDEPLNRYEFNLTRNTSSVANITFAFLTLEGNSVEDAGTGEDCAYLFANFTSQAWERIAGDTTSSTDATRTRNISATDVSKIVNATNNMTHLMFEGNAMEVGETCRTDFVQVEIQTNDVRSSNSEVTSVETNYTNVISTTMTNISLINISVTVSANSSIASSGVNLIPDLQLRIWNGTDYENQSMYFNLSNAARPVTLNVSTSASNIVTAWRATGNRSIQIKAVNLDSSATTNDEINWTAVTVDLIYQGNTHWTYNWTDTSTAGVYNITEAFVNDSTGQQNRTSWAQAAWFNVTVGGAATCTPSTGGAWFNAAWDKRKSICINESQIVASHLNFPVLINITDTNLTTLAQADGDDILFANDTVQFAHEIEYFNATDGRLVAWVNIPNLTGGFNFSMYYNNSAASNQQNRPGTWNNDFVAVYHFSETDLDGGAGDIKDSTKYGHNGTAVALRPENQVQGRIGGAFDFNQTGAINLSSFVPVSGAGARTISYWIKPNASSVAGDVAKWGSGDIDEWHLRNANPHSPRIFATDTQCNSEPSGGNIVPSGQVWAHIAWAGSNNLNTYTFHKNGSLIFSCTTNAAVDTQGTGLYIAGDYAMILDELKISNVTRSTQWTKTEYANQVNGTYFTVFGGEEIAPVSAATPTFGLNLTNYFSNVTYVNGANNVPFTLDIPISPVLTNTNQSFVVKTQTFANSCPHNINILNTTTVKINEIHTNCGSPLTNVSSYVVEFDSGIFVLRGNISVPTTGSEVFVNLSSSVNRSKALIIAYDTTTQGDNAHGDHFFANFTNATQIYFNPNQTGSRVDIEWQVVEFLDNTTVQSGVLQARGAGSKFNATINSVNLSKAFLVFYYNLSTAANAHVSNLRGNITSPTTIQFSRNTSATLNANDQFDISWFVVNLSHENASVQQVDSYVPGEVSVASFNISAVNTQRSIIIGSTECNSNNYGECITMANFTNSTLVRMIRNSGTRDPTGNVSSTWYIITFPPNSCAPKANTDWALACADNCIVTGNTAQVNNINATGVGSVTIQHSNITYGNFSTAYTCGWSWSYDSRFVRRY